MSSSPERTPAALPDSLAAGFFGGVLGGFVLLALGFLHHGLALRSFSPSDSLAFWLCVRSTAVYPLLGGGLGGILGGLLHPLLRLHPAGQRWIFALVAGLSIAAVALVEFTARGQLVTLEGLPLGDPARWEMARLHAFIALGIGGSLTGLLRCLAPGRHLTGRHVVVFGGILSVLWGAAAFALRRPSATPSLPSQVVVVGLDGMTFRVLAPLLRSGELPTFRRLVEESAWGTFMTYGSASSPRVWTTLATGHRVRDHGIDDFVHAERGSYRTVPMKSFDRKTRALWDILGEAGHRVAVVNWLITFPPELVNGFMVPRLNTRDRLVTHPPELADELHALLLPRPKARKTPTASHFKHQIDRTFDTAEHLLAKEPLSFLALMNASCDAAQHRLWKFYEPAAFEPGLWDLQDTTADEIRKRGRVIPTVYSHLDRRLGKLLARLDENTLLIVVSDHGQGPARRPRVHLRLDRLLADLGWAHLAQEPRGRQTLDLERSRSYPLVETPWTPMMRVNLNLEGREAKGIVPPDEADSMLHLLATELAAVHFENSDPLFGEIEIREHVAGENVVRYGADLRLPLSPGVRDPQGADRTLIYGDHRAPLRRYLDIDTSISGEHDPQGVIFLRGPGVRPGHIGQRTVTTSLHELIWHLTDKVDAIDLLLPPLRRLGLLDTATTLDLTPTVLYAFGLPVARDMEGRPLQAAYTAPEPVRLIDTWEQGERTGREQEGDTTKDEEEDEEVLDRLRSLGYVN